CRHVRSFFFQAEDGIRDFHVTGVQTCALPIYAPGGRGRLSGGAGSEGRLVAQVAAEAATAATLRPVGAGRGGRGGRPRVVDRRAPAEAALPRGLVHLRGGVPQRGADLVDLDLVDGAALALLGLVRALPEPAVDDHPHATRQAR